MPKITDLRAYPLTAKEAYKVIEYVDPSDQMLIHDGAITKTGTFTFGELVQAKIESLIEEYFKELESSGPQEAYLSVRYRQATVLPKAKFHLNAFKKWTEKKLSSTSKES